MPVLTESTQRHGVWRESVYRATGQWSRGAESNRQRRDYEPRPRPPPPQLRGAGSGDRNRGLDDGNVALYRLSYARVVPLVVAYGGRARIRTWVGRKPLSFSKRAPWTARPLFHVWGEPPDLNRHRPGSRPGAFPIKLGSPVFWRRLRGSNPHALPGITGFKPDKHASLASLRSWRCGPELNRHRLDRQSRALPLSYRTGK